MLTGLASPHSRASHPRAHAAAIAAAVAADSRSRRSPDQSSCRGNRTDRGNAAGRCAIRSNTLRRLQPLQALQQCRTHRPVPSRRSRSRRASRSTCAEQQHAVAAIAAAAARFAAAVAAAAGSQQSPQPQPFAARRSRRNRCTGKWARGFRSSSRTSGRRTGGRRSSIRCRIRTPVRSSCRNRSGFAAVVATARRLAATATAASAAARSRSRLAAAAADYARSRNRSRTGRSESSATRDRERSRNEPCATASSEDFASRVILGAASASRATGERCRRPLEKYSPRSCPTRAQRTSNLGRAALVSSSGRSPLVEKNRYNRQRSRGASTLAAIAVRLHALVAQRVAGCVADRHATAVVMRCGFDPSARDIALVASDTSCRQPPLRVAAADAAVVVRPVGHEAVAIDAREQLLRRRGNRDSPASNSNASVDRFAIWPSCRRLLRTSDEANVRDSSQLRIIVGRLARQLEKRYSRCCCIRCDRLH